MANLWNDIKHSLHMFFKNPGFTIAAIAALALGIGANTAIFTVVDAVLLKPLTYPNSDRIMQLMNKSADGEWPGASITKFHNWQRQTSIFKEVAAFDWSGPGYNITGERPEQVHGLHVTEGYFRLFGAPILLGRTFTPQEDAPNGGKVVVISYGLWQRKFGGDPQIVGKVLSLGNEPYTIIGVIGRDFFTDPASDIWLPFQFPPNSDNQGHYFQAAAMLKPGITVDQANAQMKLAGDQFHRDWPKADPDGTFSVKPLRDSIIGDARKSLLILLGAVGMVLLIACANVANLLLVRATGRKREFAIRSALGAGRARIIRQLLTESVLLSVIGGALGLGLGFAGVRALLAISPAGLPRIGEDGAAVGIDWRVLGFTLAVSLFTGILFGVFPALAASRTDLNSTLKESSSRSGTGFRQSKARSLLVVFEVFLAVILLVGASLLIRTYLALRGVNPGFDARNVLTMEMSLTGDRFQKTGGVAQLSRDGRERLNAIPGVEVAASTCCLPLEGGFGLPFTIVGHPFPGKKADDEEGAGWMNVSPGYFDVFKIPILRGRDFKESDSTNAPGVVIINQAMADKYWPKDNPVGQQIVIGKGVGPDFVEPARQIIGVAGNVHNDLADAPRPMMIVPQAQVTDGMTALNARIGPVVWVLRTHGDPSQASANIIEQLRQASGGFPVARVRPMTEVVVRSTSQNSFNMLLFTIFGAVALVLAAIGIYGLMAYSVQQRTQEIGIRMALGADRATIRKLVVWHGMQLALVGVVLGIAASFALTRLIASFLFGVKSWDPTVFISVPIVLSAVALIAVWLPATRAARLDPMQALRVD
jgi:predicted permease